MAKHRINIRGRISRNEDKSVLEWWGFETTSPSDVQKVIDASSPGDDIDVYINSGGGEITSGSEIYTILREASASRNVNIYITGDAASAASVIACAAHSSISPTAQMMLHCVSCHASGNHNDLEKVADILSTADKAMCRAYMDKAGITEEEAIGMMERETWLNAQQAVDAGLVDEIMFSTPQTGIQMSMVDRGYMDTATINKMRAAMLKDQTSQPVSTEEHTGPGYEDAIRRNREINQLRLSVGRSLMK